MHNTSSETMTYYDLDCLPVSHQQEFEAIRAVIEQALDRVAYLFSAGPRALARALLGAADIII